MWYRITIIYKDGKISSGIRKIDDDNIYRVEMRVLETLKSFLFSIRNVDVSMLSDNHPDVQALLKNKVPSKDFDSRHDA